MTLASTILVSPTTSSAKHRSPSKAPKTSRKRTKTEAERPHSPLCSSYLPELPGLTKIKYYSYYHSCRLRVSFCYIFTHALTHGIECNGLATESTMFSSSCAPTVPWYGNCTHFSLLAVLIAWSVAWPQNEETILSKSAPHSRTRRSCIGGFSMVELVVSMTILLILTAIAIPSLMRSFRAYQLNDAAGRFSDMLKFTRFEAVRRNTQVCFLQQSGPGWTVGTSSTCGAVFDANGKRQVIAGFASPLPANTAGLPGQGAICNKLVNNSGPCLNGTLSGTNNATVQFDARGAIRVGGNVSSNLFVFYIGSANDQEFGYRAVVLLPSGTTQIWTGPAGGPWQQIS